MSHSRQTEHYGLPLYDGTDIINPLTDFNNANEAIDTVVYNANQKSVQAETTANEAKDIAEGYDSRVTQAIQTANDAMTLANNTQDMIAEEFNPMKEGGYQVGDFVIYNGVLYKFINAHTGAWDASDVQVSPVLIDALEDVVEEGKQAIEEAVEEAEEEIAGQTEKVTKTQAMIAQPFDENKVGGYAVDDVVTYADKLYKFTSTHSGAWTGLDVEQVDVIGEVDEIIAESEARQTEKVTKTQAMVAQPFDENKVDGYAVDDVVTYADKLYKFTSAHSGAWTGLDVEQVDVIVIVDDKIGELNEYQTHTVNVNNNFTSYLNGSSIGKRYHLHGMIVCNSEIPINTPIIYFGAYLKYPTHFALISTTGGNNVGVFASDNHAVNDQNVIPIGTYVIDTWFEIE